MYTRGVDIWAVATILGTLFVNLLCVLHSCSALDWTTETSPPLTLVTKALPQLPFSLYLRFIYSFYLSSPCATGEMINGRPVFPGTSTINQIERIIEVINMPSKSDVDAIASVYTATMLESLPQMNFKLLGECLIFAPLFAML